MQNLDRVSRNYWRWEIQSNQVSCGHFTSVLILLSNNLQSALLELEDLLPADDEKACTAVCVQIMWNRRDKPSEAFCAQIDRITADDWRAELTTLYEDVTEDSKFGIGDDDEPDLDRNERIAKAFHKLKCVYPEIKDLEDLKCHSVEQLMEHPNIKPILGKTQYYTSESLEVFAGLIKPFIDSSTSKGKKAQSYFAQWPLVKMVFLEVKSHILEDGVCLVDLPGSQDTNAARGAIAEEFQRKLSVSCIVAPTTRASSDKPVSINVLETLKCHANVEIGARAPGKHSTTHHAIGQHLHQ